MGRLRIVVVAAAATLSGCTGLAGGPEAPVLTVRGELAYRARIALAPDAVAIVELRDASAGEGRVVAEQRIELKGRQVPVPFELAVDRARLTPGQRYSVRGGFVVGGRPAWVSEPVAIDPAAKAVDVGTLVLTPFRPMGFASDWDCGEQRITAGFIDNLMRIRAGAETIDLRPVPAASGAKYQAVDDPSTTFWSKGDRARFTLRGRTLPECLAAAKPGRSPQGGGSSPAPTGR